MEWLHRNLLKLKFYADFIEWTKHCILPGFSSLPLYTVATFFFREIGKDELLNKSSSLAYNFMLAIFPAIIFLFTLIPFVPINHFQDQLLGIIELLLPSNAYIAFEATLKDIIKNQNGGLLSFGFFSAIFFATNGVVNLMKAFNRSSLIIETRGWLKKRLIALVLTFAIVVSIIICIGALAASDYVRTYLQLHLHFKHNATVDFAVLLLKWVFLVGLYFINISMLYRYGPSHTKKWKLFSSGAFLATILAFLTIWGFTFYINHFASYNKVYGSIGTLIVIMIWLYLNSLILLVGFELNASIQVSKRVYKLVKPKFNAFKEANLGTQRNKD
ncbi:membrane protein [Pedobacter sp. UYP30]|uniref:YihY/virulence factor BrkB family protein n=1 Tax=Pedobacter sp. UYP30 TaxID=1756400 RepID=UPI003392CA1C